jgi:hypothetical protein
MSELKDVPQASSQGLVRLPTEIEQAQNKCPVILQRGKRTGEVCNEPTWGNPKCSSHMLADKRKYGSSNPFTKALEEAKQPEKPFTIINDEEDEEFEDLPEVQPPPPPEVELDDVEEITISLKNVKAVCFKIVRPR